MTNKLLDSHKTWIFSSAALFALSIPILIYFFTFSSCHPIFERCDHFIADLGNNRKGVFCLNETNSILKSMHIYDCSHIIKFSLFDTYEIFKALKIYFKNEKLATAHTTNSTIKYCPYLFHEHLVKFCLNSNRLLSHVELFDKITMNPHEAYQLHIYLKVFLK